MNTPIRWLVLLSALGLVGGCATPIKPVAAPVEAPARFSESGGQPPPAQWWTVLNDAQLNELMDRAMVGNLSLQATWDRLEQAEATARKDASELFPQLSGSASANRSVVVTHFPMNGNENRVKTYNTEFGLGLQLSYEVDLWGRVRSTANAAQLDLLASQEDLHTAAITLSMEVANTWYQLVEKTAELRLLQEQIAINENYLNVILFRFRNGNVSAVDVLQQEGLLEATNTERINAQSQIKVLKNKLAVLVGEVPERFEIEPAEALPTLPPLPDTGIPAVWMNDRPDLKAAYFRIQSADQRAAAAVADQFPRLSLSANASTADEHLRDLFDNWIANMAANLAGPIFDGFRRQSEVQRTRAVAREKLHTYGDLILKALQEVENALKQEHYQHQLLASVEIRLDLSRKSNQQILTNYINGNMEFLRYLTAQVSYQELQRVYLQRQLELVQYRINLYRALGRSWLMERNIPPSSEIPQAKKPQEKIIQTETVNG